MDRIKDALMFSWCALVLFLMFVGFVFLTGALFTVWSGGEFVAGGVDNIHRWIEFAKTGEFPDGY